MEAQDVKTFSIPTSELGRGGKYEILTRVPIHLLIHPDVLGPVLQKAGFRLDGRIRIDDTQPGVVLILQPENEGEM